MDKKAILKKAFPFKGLSEEVLADISEIFAEDNAVGGDLLFSEGEKADKVYCVVMGSMRLMKKNRSGEDEEVGILGTGAFFGEIAGLLEDSERSVSAVVSEPSRYISCNFSDLASYFEKNPAQGMTFYRNISVGIAKRLKIVNRDVSFLKTFVKERHQ